MNTVKELKYGSTRCYCINNQVLVDTNRAGTLLAFFKSIKENHIELKELQYLIITHFHPDHMGIAIIFCKDFLCSKGQKDMILLQ